ncbi:MAG: hypothetical protein IJF59_03955 [Clostridia bacterium]|nr:hypothetical protein [Clostridia bacterium]
MTVADRDNPALSASTSSTTPETAKAAQPETATKPAEVEREIREGRTMDAHASLKALRNKHGL